ncbi:Acid_sphingomyelinase [Hexamita inflata]|uniref:Acid sphingomyelinase n=1 Tax=Hexamita inflata TaxID=28002 RepID=A0AA86QMK9_9EUKA|nr:Acid sphingomyelinase [Hexamita inflata]
MLVQATLMMNALIISDIHIDNEYLAGGQRKNFCRAKNPWELSPASTNFPRGQFGCDLPLAAWEDIAKQFDYDSVDVVFLLGDVPGHGLKGSSFNQTFSQFAMAIESIPRSIPILPVVGNNELDEYYMPVDGPNPQLERLTDLLQKSGVLHLNEMQIKTFQTGGFYSTIINQTPVLVLNTVIYTEDFWRKQNSEPTDDPRDQFKFIEEFLKVNEKYIVLQHICFGINPYSGNLQMYPLYHQKLLEMFKDNKPASVMCGHTHKDGFKILNGIPIFNAPGLSPNSYNNPAFRYMNITNGAVTDYVQFMSSLNEANANNASKIEFDYRFSDYYGMSPSAANLEALAEQMTTDEKMYAKYIENDDIFYNNDSQQFVCAMETPTTQEYTDCMEIWGKMKVEWE